jgi:hypothetical protein
VFSVLALFAVSMPSDCFDLTDIPFDDNYVIFGNSCWAVKGGSFGDDTNLTIELGVADSGTFFGTDTYGVRGLLANLFVTQGELPVLEELDYDAFREPVSLLCGRAVDDDYLVEHVFRPEGVQTSEDDNVVYRITIDRNNSDYWSCFHIDGNCLILVRDITRLNSPGVGAGECVALILGLLAGGVLIAWCIVWLAPMVKKAEEAKKEKEGEAEPDAEAKAESEA